MPADILLYALVAAGLVFWLRNILGTRHGDENQRSNPFTELPDTSKKATHPATDTPSFGGDLVEDPALRLDKNVSFAGAGVEDGLSSIANVDRGFDLSVFTKGAQDAFVIIVEAFADKDKEMLENLLAPALYKSFASVIDEREKKGETASVEIHAVRKIEILDAGMDRKTAHITVRFIADETSILRDKDDKLLFGDPERVTETRDIWTFSRDTRSRDPKWMLVTTREDEEDEQNGSTVPEEKASSEGKDVKASDKADNKKPVATKSKSSKKD